MLSVLIPTYNYNASVLVKELHKQLLVAEILFEIICVDDGSKSKINKINQEINSFSNSSFTELKTNIGRSAIRNLLASSASYNWLLFLDADVLPNSTTFIANYLAELKTKSHKVLIGGINYQKSQENSLLRWRLGEEGEVKSAKERAKKPFKCFFTANFLIDKSIFKTLQFNEELTKYGYEDLLFSKGLQKNNITIKHLDNTVCHLGIDKNVVFINKTKEALQNLAFLLKAKKILIEDTQISMLYFKLNKLGFTNFLSLFTVYFEKIAVKKSSLFYYHLFRLSYLDRVFKKSK